MRRAIPVLLLLAALARADRMAPPPTPERMARTDLAVLAKVVRVEDKTVELPVHPGVAGKQAYRVAVLEVKEQIAGSPAVKTVRLALSPPSRRDPLLNVKAGDERLFFLTKHHGTEYYRTAMPWDVEAPLEAHLGQARRAGKLLASPAAGLGSRAAADRTLAAALLIVRYRTPPMADPKDIKEEPVPAGESKDILEALAAADWKAPEYSSFSPRSLFLKLGLTEKDGWKVTNFATLDADAKKWLLANAGKYRMKKYTVGTAVEP